MNFSFTWKNRKFQFEKQVVRAINDFGKLQKIWAVICGDAIFLLFLVCSAELDIPCSRTFSRHVKFYSFIYVYAQDFHPRGLCKW